MGAIVYDSGPKTKNDFDIIVHLKDNTPQRISKLHPLYMALQFPLLFVFGQHGWSPELKLVDNGSRRRQQLTMNMFYSFQLHDRFNHDAILLRGGRLFQQYLVNAYICIKQNRLDYIESTQNTLRNEYLEGVHDALLRGDSNGRDVGKRIILPASFTGGPRYMYKHYQDALAICRVHGNPQYFITFTCNVKWPEVKRFIQRIPGCKAQDRPDIVVRVFKMKVDDFIAYLKNERPFGEVAAGCPNWFLTPVSGDECDEWINMRTLLDDVLLNDNNNRWVWNGDSLQIFTVKSVKKFCHSGIDGYSGR